MLKQIICAGLIGISSVAQAATLQHLSFLSGCWRGSDDQATNEECWGTAEGGLMLGTAKTIAGGQADSFEFMKIIETASGIVYTPLVNGNEAVSFPLTSATSTSVVFANPKHDFPKQIGYARTGDVLSITLSGEDESGQPMEIRYQLQKITQ